MLKSITQKLDLSEKFKALPETEKWQVLEKLNQTLVLGMRQLILDNLDPKEDKTAVQEIFKTGSDDDLFILGSKKIPGFNQKVESFINDVVKDFEQELQP